MRKLLLSCLPFVVAVGLPSQATHLVGAGGLPDINAALAIASPGDRIHIATGSYPGFVADKGVTIRPVAGASVWIGGPGLPSVIAADVPAGQTLNLVALSMSAPVHVTGGRVTLDQCYYSGTRSALVVSDASVHLQNTTMVTGLSFTPVSTVIADNADITAVGCTLNCSQIVLIPVPTLDLTATRLHVSGGSIVQQAFAAGAAMRIAGGTHAWVADCDVQTAAPCPVDDQGGTVRFSRSPGLMSVNPACAAPVAGPPLLGVTRSSPLQPGGLFTLAFRGEPNGFVVVFASADVGKFDWAPLLEQPSWLDDLQSVSVTVILADAAGDSAASWSLPGNPAILDLALWFKGLGGPSWPLQVTPPIGGVVR